MAQVTPFIRSPFTDITGCLVSHQWYGRCKDFELAAVECMEAYGRAGGLQKCDALLKDFKECHTRDKQLRRATAMRAERLRQYKEGERTKDNLFAKPAPPYESF